MKLVSAFLLAMGISLPSLVSTAGTQPPAGSGPHPPSRPATQAKIELHLDGVSGVQLAWWFQHIADAQGVYWKSLAPATNQSIN